MLRYRVSPHRARGGAGFRAALRAVRGGYQALRVSRAVLRIHRLGAAAARPRDRRRPGRRRASRQWLLGLRDAGGTFGGDDDGVHRARRAADGHPQRRARPRRGSLPDPAEGHDGGGGDRSALSPVRHARPVRRLVGFPRVAGQPGAARPVCRRVVLLLDGAPDRLARGFARRARRDRLHRRRRRERRADPRRDLPCLRLARRRAGRGGQRRRTAPASRPRTAASAPMSSRPTKT